MLTLERFWLKVEVRGADECWPWRAPANTYGRFSVRPGKSRLMGAHRFSWILANRRDIPPGLFVLHSCDNKRCVNPRHLSLGDAAQNSREAYDRGLLDLERARAARGNSTHCTRGHPLEGNSYYSKSEARRRCKTCHNARSKKYRAKERAMNNGNPNEHTQEWAN